MAVNIKDMYGNSGTVNDFKDLTLTLGPSVRVHASAATDGIYSRNLRGQLLARGLGLCKRE